MILEASAEAVSTFSSSATANSGAGDDCRTTPRNAVGDEKHRAGAEICVRQKAVRAVAAILMVS